MSLPVIETDQGRALTAARALNRAAIYRLEDAMKRGNARGKLIPFECPLTHYFAAGVYVRQMYIPAGVALVGHVHRHPCVNIIAYGEIAVATEQGQKVIIGPIPFESAAGMKRAGFAIKDTLWTTIHANPDNERDIERLELLLIEPEALLEDLS